MVTGAMGDDNNKYLSFKSWYGRGMGGVRVRKMRENAGLAFCFLER
jgi:hypothetical protein